MKPNTLHVISFEPRLSFTAFEKCSSRVPEGIIKLAVTTTLEELMLVHLGDAVLELKAKRRSPVTEMVLKGTDATVAATMKDKLNVTFVAPA